MSILTPSQFFLANIQTKNSNKIASHEEIILLQMIRLVPEKDFDEWVGIGYDIFLENMTIDPRNSVEIAFESLHKMLRQACVFDIKGGRNNYFLKNENDGYFVDNISIDADIEKEHISVSSILDLMFYNFIASSTSFYEHFKVYCTEKWKKEKGDKNA